MEPTASKEMGTSVAQSHGIEFCQCGFEKDLEMDSPQEPPEKSRALVTLFGFGLVGPYVKKPAKPTRFLTHRTMRKYIYVV